MKKFALLAVVFLPFILSAQSIAYVSADSILKSIPAYATNLQKIDNDKKTYQKELETAQASIQQKYESLIKPYAPKETETLITLKKRMSPTDTLSLSLIVDDNKQLELKKQTYNKIIQANYNTDVQPILDNVNKTITDYAKLNKYSMVIIIEQLRPAFAYIDPKQDITTAIIQKLKVK